MPAFRSPLPLTAARTVALHAQALTAPLGHEPAPTPDAIYDVVNQVGCVQIDTLHMVHRSHYVVMWSRLGRYDPADFDRLVYADDERRLFEYWMHAASIIPLSEYRYRLREMRQFEEGGGWWPEWARDPDNRALIERVLDRIREEGALRSADFQHDGHQGGTWWNWKPTKRALENLYNRGLLMIRDRVNFQRIYDLRERVLPEWVDTTLPSVEETERHLIERAARGLGLGTANHLADYAYLRVGEARPAIEALLAEGVLVDVPVEVVGGAEEALIAHRDTLPLIEAAADGALQARRTTFLSPFDSLFWGKGRDEQLWGFVQRLEAYKPAPQRIWGYFCLAILHRDRLVGRFDPKLDRKTGTLYLRALYLEPGEAPTDELVADVAAAMRDFMAFHAATELVIEASDPEGFGTKLAAQVAAGT